MAGKNIIMSRGVPVQKNDPAILQTLSDKAVTRLVNGKITDYNGSNIDPYEFTWAEFLTLVSTDYAGITIRITDRHQDSRGVGGVYFVGGTSWVLESKCIYYATLAAAPSPVTWPGLRIFAANVGISGSELTSNGTVYRPDATHITLVNNLNLISRANGASPDINQEWQPLAVRLPRDFNNKSIFQDGDYLTIWNAWAEKTGITDSLTVSLRFGTSNTTSDAQLLSAPGSSTGANVERIIRFAEIQRVDSTHLRWRGLQSTILQFGPLGTTRAIDIPVADMDYTSDSYFNIGIYLSALNDSNIGLREYEVRLVKGY